MVGGRQICLLRYGIQQGSGNLPSQCWDGKVERVASLQNFRRVVNPWLSWMGLTPDGSPLLMRDIGSQEVYALDFEEP